MNRDFSVYKKIYVAGHRGMVGSAIVSELQQRGHGDKIVVRHRDALDLINQHQVDTFFKTEKPDCVFFAAAKVGGIHSNMAYPAQYVYENMMMGFNVVNSAEKHGVRTFINIGSSCAYPKDGIQPFKESSVFDGNYEVTNAYYALAKVAVIKMGEAYNKQYNFDYVSIIPCNVFGINDYFEHGRSHVVGALITRFHHAKIHRESQVVVWGTGNARREFIFSKDVGRGIVTISEYAEAGEIFNLGVAEDISIRELAYMVAQVVGYKGDIVFDTTKPEGMMRKKVCTNKQDKIGFNPIYDMKTALQETYDYYLQKDNIL